MSNEQQRNELADMVYRSGYPNPDSPRIQPLSERAQWEIDSHYNGADAILAAGYRKPKVLGYIVVDRGGVMVGNQHKYRESAQVFVDEWSADCKTAGIDWDYRVAEIVEAPND